MDPRRYTGTNTDGKYINITCMKSLSF